MYKIEHGTTKITCDTSEEFEQVMNYIQSTLGDQSKIQNSHTVGDLIASTLSGRPIDYNPWTHRVFSDFVDAVGHAQKTVLALLVRQTRATDAELRKAVGVDNNQQLAGILSGLSKQAAAFNLPAREVFTIENESKSGKKTKTYVISNHFLKMATENNWPLDGIGDSEQGVDSNV